MSKLETYIALPPDLSGPWAYGSQGRAVKWAKSDVEKAALADLPEIIIILAGENVRRFRLDLAGLRGRELKSAIEFELEDRMGGNLPQERICQDRKNAGDVALISVDYAEAIGQALAHHGLKPTRIIVDYEALGAGQNVQIGDRLIKGGLDGYAIDTAWASLRQDATEALEVTPDDLFSRFSATLSSDDNRPLDLRTGLGLTAANNLAWQRWAKIAALGLGLVILPFMLGRYADARAWERQAEIDQTATSKLYQTATGETPRDVARALSRRLKDGKSQAGFIDMSAILFAAIADVDGAEIDTMRYDPRQNLIQLSVRYPSFEAGVALEQAVTDHGGRLIVGGIRERGDTLIGEASLSVPSGTRS